jgi:uncharacterized OsmC-like protein
VTATEIQELYELKAAVLTRRPELARVASQAVVRLEDRLACAVEDGGRTLRADLPPEEGGTASGPHPEQLMRASLGACLAIGYRLWAARLGVPIDRVELSVTCELDGRGQLGLSTEVPVGWQRVRVEVTVVSPAPESEVRRVVETANRLSPMLANLSREVEQLHRLTVLPAERAVPSRVTPPGSRADSETHSPKGKAP